MGADKTGHGSKDGERDLEGGRTISDSAVDLHALDQTLSRLYRVTGVPVALCDADGAVILSMGVDKICSIFHDKGSGTRGGQASQGSLGRMDGPHRLRRDVYQHDARMATIHLYGIRGDGIDERTLVDQAQEAGIEAAEFMRRIDQLPRLDDPRIKDLMDLIDDLVRKAFAPGKASAIGGRDEPMLRLAIKGARLGYWERNIVEGTFKVDQQWADMLGLAPADIEGDHRAFFERVHPDDLEGLRDRLESHFRGDTPFYTAEFRLRHSNGDFVWVNGMGMVVERDPDGRPMRMLGINQDISRRKDAEDAVRSSLEEKITLLQEVHHRVKNNLALINSMLGMQIMTNRDKDVQIALKDAEARIMAMALVHEALYRTTDLTFIRAQTHFENLVNTIVHGFSSGIDIETEVVTDDISMELDTAIPCSLVVNELLTNSLKYAFPGRRRGKVAIALQRNDGLITLRYQDDGRGMPDGFDIHSVKTLGMRLVTTIVHHQLRGFISVEQGSAPTWIIRFPDQSPNQD